MPSLVVVLALLALARALLALDAGTATIRHSLQKVDGEFRLLDPKTQRSRRTITIPVQLIGEFKLHRLRQAEEIKRARGFWRNDLDLVFTDELGGLSTASKSPEPYSGSWRTPACAGSASTTYGTVPRLTC
jgi:hypothetical protein